ncbi:MAG: ABC transporter permease [Longimicrobiales bacterium]|nr:ABC transporter permease [Longimicrobiales bacterium]
MSDLSAASFRLSLALFRLLLRGYPGSFRSRFASQMVEDFRELLIEAQSRGPLRGRVHAWTVVLLDLGVSLPRERFHASRNQRPGQKPVINSPSGNFMDTTLQDIRFALRTFRRQPLFFAVAVMTLGLGIGATTAIYSVVDAALLKPLPFPEPERLMRPSLVMPRSPEAPMANLEVRWSIPKYELFKSSQNAFSATAMYVRRAYTLTHDGGPERVTGEVVESSYLGILGIGAVAGRGFSPEDDLPGGSPVVLISHGFWTRRWDGDPGALGQTINVSGTSFTVVGVLPSGFRGLSDRAEIFLPLSSLSEVDWTSPGNHSYYAVARLNDGITPVQGRIDMEAVGEIINEVYPATGHNSAEWGGTAKSLNDLRADPALKNSIFLLLGAVGFMLLIACVNLANLLLARATARRREIAIRVAVGSGRGRLIRQLMTESLLLAAGGGAVGLGLAFLGVEGLRSLGPAARGVLQNSGTSFTVLWLDRLALDGPVLLFTLAVAAGTGLLFGLAPALRASRPELTNELKAGTEWKAGSRRFGRLGGRGALVVTELALTFVLLAGSGLMLKSFLRLYAVDTGFESEGILTGFINLPSREYGPQEREVFLTELLDQVRAIPGVQAAGVNDCPPVSGGCNSTVIRFSDRPEVAVGTEPELEIYEAGSGYFETMGIPLIRGRTLDDRDRFGEPRVVLINEQAAKEFWPGEDPIGRIVRLPGRGDALWEEGAEVVGIVGDVHYESIEIEPNPAAYLSVNHIDRAGGFLYLFVSLQTDPAAATGSIRRAVRSIDPTLLMTGVQTMDELVGASTVQTRFSAGLLSLFAAVALAISAVGIFGVLSYLVAQQTRQIGIRMALGAQRGTVFRQILRRALVMTAIGVVLGGTASLGITRFMQSLLFDVRPDDPTTLVVIALTLSIVSVVAASLPAWRAMRVQPVEALRDG